MFRSSMICSVLGIIFCLRLYARGNAMVAEIQRAAAWVHLWQQGCHDTIQHMSTSLLLCSGRNGGPERPSNRNCRSGKMLEVGKNEARGENQRGKQDLTQKGEQITLLLFSYCSSFLLSSMPFFSTLASQDQQCSSVPSTTPCNLLNKDFLSQTLHTLNRDFLCSTFLSFLP